MDADVIVVGGGIAGLSFARAAVDGGRHPLVLERSRGVGGRCATRRVEGQPVDHGVAFVHGSDPTFLAAARDVPGAAVLEPWPAYVEGSGPPCQPDAFSRGESRVAYAEGVSTLPKRLARDVDVRLSTHAVGIAARGDGFDVLLSDGRPLRARDVVLALPVEAASDLLTPLARDSRDVASTLALLAMAGSAACLTVLAGYRLEAPRPAWDVLYPESSAVIQLAVHDSNKRRAPAWRVLVFQARPCWSRQHLDQPVGLWKSAILEEAGRLLGAWAAAPVWSDVQRWRHARVDRGNEFSAPLLLRWPHGGRLGLAGEVFAPGGGIEAAFESGRALARRFLGEG